MQSVLAKWYCGCLTILLEMELRNVGKGTKVGTKYILLDLRRAEVQLISPRPLDSREFGHELGVITCSLDVKQGF